MRYILTIDIRESEGQVVYKGDSKEKAYELYDEYETRFKDSLNKKVNLYEVRKVKWGGIKWQPTKSNF